MADPLQCPRCGAPNLKESRFCSGCGSRLALDDLLPLTTRDPATQTAISSDRRPITLLSAPALD